MNYSVPVARATRTTYRSHVREIGEALGLKIGANQWITLEDAEGDDELPLTGAVDVVVWERALIDPERDRAGA